MSEIDRHREWREKVRERKIEDISKVFNFIQRKSKQTKPTILEALYIKIKKFYLKKIDFACNSPVLKCL